jgi:3-hydroxyisobutyrate dehydrogenase-like beta-hydroxyacid dehydrogenase
MTRIAFIGLGEAASALISGWGRTGAANIRAFDIKQTSPAQAPEIIDRAAGLGIGLGQSLRAALEGADLIFSTVTADQAMIAARSAAAHVQAGAFFCDLNSCAPASKKASASVLEKAGARYVDVAVMAPVHPLRNMVPLLISGPHAAVVAPVLRGLPMALNVVEGEVGAASSIKMIRSVFVKGLEALTAEFILAAVAADVVDAVMPSLSDSHPGTDWDARIAFNMERVMTHGTRRAAEMEEVVKTLRDLGLPEDVTAATVRWQRRIADLGITGPQDPIAEGAVSLADMVLPSLRR